MFESRVYIISAAVPHGLSHMKQFREWNYINVEFKRGGEKLS